VKINGIYRNAPNRLQVEFTSAILNPYCLTSVLLTARRSTNCPLTTWLLMDVGVVKLKLVAQDGDLCAPQLLIRQ